MIQRILRCSNVSVTQACYIKPRDKAVVEAMAKLENGLTDTFGTPTADSREAVEAVN